MADNGEKEGLRKPTPQSHWSGLANEGVAFLTNEQIQAQIQKRNRKNDFIKLCKGMGFTIAIAAGLFGYLLKANSEADDREAKAIRAVIDEKKEWAIKVNKGIMEVRRTNHLIRLECEHGRALTSYDQKKRRFLAIDRLVKASVGLDEVYDQDILKKIGKFTDFDQSIIDVCANAAPSDDEWRKQQRDINKLMHASIQKDRQSLLDLSKNLATKFFQTI